MGCRSKSSAIAFTLMLYGLAASPSCSNRSEIDPKSERYDKFTTVYADLSAAFEMANMDSSTYLPMRDSILRRYDVDTAWIASVTRELGEGSDKWLLIWEEITRKLEATKDSLTP
jgi:hypothetical protein